MRYWLRNGVCTYTCGDDDNSRMEMAKWVKVDYDCFAKKEIIQEKPKIEIPKKEEPIVEEEKSVETIAPKEGNNLLKWLGYALIVVIVSLGYWLFKGKKDNGSHKKSEELPKV